MAPGKASPCMVSAAELPSLLFQSLAGCVPAVLSPQQASSCTVLIVHLQLGLIPGSTIPVVTPIARRAGLGAPWYPRRPAAPCRVQPRLPAAAVPATSLWRQRPCPPVHTACGHGPWRVPPAAADPFTSLSPRPRGGRASRRLRPAAGGGRRLGGLPPGAGRRGSRPRRAGCPPWGGGRSRFHCGCGVGPTGRRRWR